LTVTKSTIEDILDDEQLEEWKAAMKKSRRSKTKYGDKLE